MFRNMKNLTSRPIELQEKVFQMIFKTAAIESYDATTKDKLINAMITQNDIHNYVTTAREEGLEEGLEKGKAEGEINGRILVAKNLLKSGDDDSKILAVTGISKEQMEINERET